MAEQTWKCVLADPPWEYDRAGYRASVDNGKGKARYSTICDAEMETLHIPAAEDAVMLMWATFPNLVTGMRTMRAWGFELRGVFCVWLKGQKHGTGVIGGQGAYTGGSTELVLMGARGAIDVRAPGICIVSRGRLGHSVKPEAVFPLVLDLCALHDLGRPLEMFARCTTREGFDYGIGNQKELYAGVPPEEIGERVKEVWVDSQAPKPKRPRVVVLEKAPVGERIVVEGRHRVIFVRLCTPEYARRLDAIGAMQKDSALVLEADAQTLLDLVDVLEEKMRYKALLFFAYDARDPTYSRYYVLGMPEGARISVLRTKLMKQGVDVTWVEGEEARHAKVLESAHNFFGPLDFLVLDGDRCG